ncbi:TPM domain-containing protein [Terrihabitans sp. B22-R8]|uniref:TPM domain-containing protein n=1 Tax=Terrihabitans sp. B22-R8 TaxID=3425128 RepID=UPI00403C792E
MTGLVLPAYGRTLSALRSIVLAVLLLVATALCGGMIVHADPAFPALSGRVVDEAEILDIQTEALIEGKLAELERKSSDQLVVVTLRSLQGYDIADYGYRLGRHWGIGQKGTNNGALLLVAPNERKVRIEVGYGLEGAITDAASRFIIENAILPRFRANDFAGGVSRGVDDLVQLLEGDEDFKRRIEQAAQGSRATEDSGGIPFVVLVFIGFWILTLMFGRRNGRGRRRRGTLPVILPFPGSFGGGGGGGFGGGFGGGGGGFSGGGGSFGGGGSSGSW